MRILRKPEFSHDITPETLSPLYDAVAKLSNISGTGCTVTELPQGVSISVPVPDTTPSGFWAIIGDPQTTGYGGYNQQSNDPRCYQWQQAAWITGDTTHNETSTSGTYCKPLGFDSSSNSSSTNPGLTSTLTKVSNGSSGNNAVQLIINRAREANDAINVPWGAIVWLEPGATYTVHGIPPGSSSSPGRSSNKAQDIASTEYIFRYHPGLITGTLAADLKATFAGGSGGNSTSGSGSSSGPDTNAQVNVTLSDGSVPTDGPYNARVIMPQSGSKGDFCLFIPNPDAATAHPSDSSQNSMVQPYLLLWVLPKPMTNFFPDYNGGNWTRTPQTFYAYGTDTTGNLVTPVPTGPALNYAVGQQAGNDDQRDSTTTTTTVSPTGSQSYGTPVTLTATIAQSAGTGTPTGTVVFMNNGVSLGTAQLGSTSAQLQNVILPAGNQAIIANYSGDASYASSVAATLNVTITQQTPTVKLYAAPPTGTSSPNVYGSNLTLTAVLTYSPSSNVPGPSGFVIFKNSVSGSDVQVSLPTRVSFDGTNYMAAYTMNNLPAGSLNLTATYVGDANFNTADGTLTQTVNQAPLTITADSTSMLQGSTPPTSSQYTYTVTGFLLNDTYASAVTGLPALSCNVSSSSKPGTYTINCQAGSKMTAQNYTFNFNNGTMTVLADPNASSSSS